MPRDPLIVGRVPPALKQRVTDEAERTGTSTSEIIRAALTAHLEREAYLVVQGQPGDKDTFNTTTSTPLPGRPIRLVKAAQCEHRTRTGNYCRHCNRVVP